MSKSPPVPLDSAGIPSVQVDNHFGDTPQDDNVTERSRTSPQSNSNQRNLLTGFLYDRLQVSHSHGTRSSAGSGDEERVLGSSDGTLDTRKNNVGEDQPRVSVESAPASLAGNSNRNSPRIGQAPFPQEQTSNQKNRRNSNESRNSRAQSPLRLFQWPLHRLHSREEPFIPIDPFRFRIHLRSRSEDQSKLVQRVRLFFIQIYSHLLLRLPSIYFSRVSRLFVEAEVSKPEVQLLIDGCARGAPLPTEWNNSTASPALVRFKSSWEDFIDTVTREWKTLNVVSALLLSAILTMFQVNDAAQQPIIRSASLLSLVCASWSLIYGGIYIMRFWTMRSMYKATSWAEEAQKTKTSIFWNVWVLLALPAVWLSWSIIMFFVAILAFVWTTGSLSDSPQPPSQRIELIPRVIITALFALGLIYFVLIVMTFSAYGGPGKPYKDMLDTSPASPSIALPNLDGQVSANALGSSTQAVDARHSGSSYKDDLEKQNAPPETISPKL